MKTDPFRDMERKNEDGINTGKLLSSMQSVMRGDRLLFLDINLWTYA